MKTQITLAFLFATLITAGQTRKAFIRPSALFTSTWNQFEKSPDKLQPAYYFGLDAGTYVNNIYLSAGIGLMENFTKVESFKSRETHVCLPVSIGYHKNYFFAQAVVVPSYLFNSEASFKTNEFEERYQLNPKDFNVSAGLSFGPVIKLTEYVSWQLGPDCRMFFNGGDRTPVMVGIYSAFVCQL